MAERSVFVAAGKRGAAARWGPRRVIHLGDLDPEHRRLVSAFVEMARATAERKEAAAEDQTPATATTTEGTRHATPSD